MRYGLPNADKTSVLKWDSVGRNNREWFVLPNGSKISDPQEEHFLLAGYLPENKPTLGKYENLGDIVITDTEITYNVVPWDYATIRSFIDSEIKRIARYYLDQPAQEYSNTEAIEWANDRVQYRASNVGHFQMRAGQYMTAQQYVDTKLKPKIEAASYFSEQIKGIRTDLDYELATTADIDLATFDYTSRWDEVGDFVAPDTADIPTTWWQDVISMIQWWK